MCVSDWRVNKKERWRQKWEAEEPVRLSRSRSRPAHWEDQDRTCSAGVTGQQFPNYTDPHPAPQWFYQLCSSSSQLQLGCFWATIKVLQIPILAAWSFSHWALCASPTGKCCWRKYFGDMEIKQDTALGRQAAFYKEGTRQQRAGTLWWGKHATEGGEGTEIHYIWTVQQ